MNPRHTRTPPADLHWPATTDLPPLKRGVVQVWCSLLHARADLLAALEPVLSAEETQRAARFRTEELRHRHLVSRAILRTVLGRGLGIPPAQVKFVTESNGKPRLAGGQGIEFNLAHTGDLLLLAVTREGPLGVDVERIRRLQDAQAIASRFFSDREADWLRRREEAELDRAFFRLWTRKEAVLKATGEGISSGLASLELLGAEGAFVDTVAREPAGLSDATWSLIELDPARGFVGALALPAPADRVELQRATWQLQSARLRG